jgi:putative nucleotidyltransferase with HDIG domain
MDPDELPRAPRRAPDIAAWSVVVFAAAATVGTAIATVTGYPGLSPYATSVSAGALVIAIGIAVMRHARASQAAAKCKEAYDIAFASEVAARERLAFARHAAVLMATPPLADGLRAVLLDALERFKVDAAAIVGEDITVVTAEGVERTSAQAGVLRVALETVRAGRAVANELTDEGASALTIPLRIRGQLKNVIVLWRRGSGFGPDDLDGLSLVARIVELSMENYALLDEARDQLSGTLHMMIDLVEQRLPDYGAHSTRVSNYVVAVARFRGMPEDEVEDLRVAALLHDVGMLAVPESILNTPRRLTMEEQVELQGHPEQGAELTRVANFPKRVQDAIRSHHERFTGHGYPDGLKGEEIPIASRILSVCDAFVALISDRPHRSAVAPAQALEILRTSADGHYDGSVVDDFITIYEQGVADVPEPAAPVVLVP